LWSDKRIPIPFFLKPEIIFFKSETDMGSIPEKGSSSSINRGDVISALAISSLLLSPPDSESA